MSERKLRLQEVELLLSIEEFHQDEYKVQKLKRIKEYLENRGNDAHKSELLHRVVKTLKQWNTKRNLLFEQEILQ